MSRTSKLKLAYSTLYAVAVFAGVWVGISFKFRPAVLAGLAVVFLIPGRVTGYLWMELLAARRLMDAHRHEEAVPLLDAFLGRLEKKPWLGKLIWISPSMYTLSAKAMGLNNRGVCMLEIGDLDAAERDLKDALAIDAPYPMPHYNLAILEMVRKREDVARFHAEEAKRLGLVGGSFDQTVDRVKSVYARVEPMARME